MLTEDRFNALVGDVAKLNGISEDLAADLVAYVGDTPQCDENGELIACDSTGRRHLIRWPEEEDETSK